jgi:DNA-binding response OmpR family regulator
MLAVMDRKPRRRVAIVDDDPGVLRALGRLVRSLGFDADGYASAEPLLDRAAAVPPDAVLLDLHLPGLRGPEAIAALHDRGVRGNIVVMTGLDRPGAREACLAAGAAAYLVKPLHRDELAALLGAADPECLP